MDVVRSFRVLDFAVFDFVLAFTAMYFIGKYFNKTRTALYLTLPLSVLAHYLVGSRTPLTEMVVGPGFWGVKLLMVILVFLSLS